MVPLISLIILMFIFRSPCSLTSLRLGIMQDWNCRRLIPQTLSSVLEICYRQVGSYIKHDQSDWIGYQGRSRDWNVAIMGAKVFFGTI